MNTQTQPFRQLFEEGRNAARSLVREVELMRYGRAEPDDGLPVPREK